MQASSASVTAPGETARICISLVTEGQRIAGTQNDLVWDGDCATLTESSCTASTAHGKSLNTTFPGGSSFRLRAFVLSITDVLPIPDGELYCCDFISELNRPGSCPIRVRNARASDPDGNPISVSTTNAAITFEGAGSGGGDGDGCVLAADDESRSPWLVGGLLALVAARRIRRRSTRPGNPRAEPRRRGPARRS